VHRLSGWALRGDAWLRACPLKLESRHKDANDEGWKAIIQAM
jgi:hypothetical protein